MDAKANGSPLNPTERKVLRAIAQGLREREIAERLHLQPRSVAKHRTAIMRKLGAVTLPNAVAIARWDDLLPREEDAPQEVGTG